MRLVVVLCETMKVNYGVYTENNTLQSDNVATTLICDVSHVPCSIF